jgi:hypothetical protein
MEPDSPEVQEAIRQGMTKTMADFNMAEAIQIVFDLARLDPEMTISISTITGDTEVVCITCENIADERWDPRHRQIVTAPIVHTEKCIWRRAREWVAAHEETTNVG